MRMAHKFLRREHAMAVQALYALINGRVVQFWIEHAFALAEALVIHPEAGTAGWVLGQLGVSVQERVAQAFSVSFRDQSRARRALR